MSGAGVTVYVVDGAPRTSELVRQVREWSVEGTPTQCRDLISEIRHAKHIDKALSAVGSKPDHAILVVSGISYENLKTEISEDLLGSLEMILKGDENISGVEDFPTSSVIPKSKIIITKNIVAALRKKLLRTWALSLAEIRQIESTQDLEEYFAFRFLEWDRRGFIPAERRSANARLEIESTDRTATPVGMYESRKDASRLIGCVRLVRESGEENPSYVRAVQQLIRRKRDPVLREAFALTPSPPLPFDILEEFPEFEDYYAATVRGSKRVAEISRVIVDPDWRKSRVGEVLVDTAISMANQESIHILFLACSRNLKEYYSLCGFEELKGVWSEKFLNINVPSIVMQRIVS